MKLSIIIAVLSCLVTLALSEDAPNCPECHSKIYLTVNNCSQYWECDNGVATLRECPSDSHFNPEEEECDFMWSFEHEVPCSKWTEDDLECPTNELLLDTMTELPGTNTEMPSTTTTTTKLSSTTTESPISDTKLSNTTTELPSTTTKIPSTTTQMPSSTSSSSVDCSSGAEFISNKNDCTTYYQCANGVAVLRPCPQGLHWNAKKNYCDWPKNAGCKQVS